DDDVGDDDDSATDSLVDDVLGGCSGCVAQSSVVGSEPFSPSLMGLAMLAILGVTRRRRL
ncbi:MAG: hypothetical protein CL928_11195, partial [Deltaproteobacteria bacterium]|nr:hypothetical protein [Deltaproteobacteria bacterium]